MPAASTQGIVDAMETSAPGVRALPEVVGKEARWITYIAAAVAALSVIWAGHEIWSTWLQYR